MRAAAGSGTGVQPSGERVRTRLTVNYRYNVTDGTLKKLRHIRFYVIPA